MTPSPMAPGSYATSNAQDANCVFERDCWDNRDVSGFAGRDDKTPIGGGEARQFVRSNLICTDGQIDFEFSVLVGDSVE